MERKAIGVKQHILERKKRKTSATRISLLQSNFQGNSTLVRTKNSAETFLFPYEDTMWDNVSKKIEAPKYKVSPTTYVTIKNRRIFRPH